MTLEEDTLETPGDTGKAASVSGSEGPSEATAEPVDINEVKAAVIPEKSPTDPNNPFDNDEEIMDDPEQTDEPSETQPLNSATKGRTPKTSVAKDNGDIDGDPEVQIVSREDLDSPVPKKRGWDCRCVVVGLLILVIMVGGAAVAILAQKFKSKYMYRLP